jgi:hypothetical protein
MVIILFLIPQLLWVEAVAVHILRVCQVEAVLVVVVVVETTLVTLVQAKVIAVV